MTSIDQDDAEQITKIIYEKLPLAEEAYQVLQEFAGENKDSFSLEELKNDGDCHLDKKLKQDLMLFLKTVNMFTPITEFALEKFMIHASGMEPAMFLTKLFEAAEDADLDLADDLNFEQEAELLENTYKKAGVPQDKIKSLAAKPVERQKARIKNDLPKVKMSALTIQDVSTVPQSKRPGKYAKDILEQKRSKKEDIHTH